MTMFLSGVSTIVIQRVGRWESDAFMEYIQEQVESFTVGVSEKMIRNESFYHLNNDAYMHSKDKKAYNQSCMENGEPIITPNLANFPYCYSPNSIVRNNPGKYKGENGGHANSSSDKFE